MAAVIELPRRLTSEQSARFWEKVALPSNAGECWEWQAGKDKDGYGKFSLVGRTVRPHRLSYVLRYGSIPEGLELDHTCRNRACINPSHLDPVTGKVNTLRGETITAQNARRTECVNGHPFDVSYVRDGTRRRGCSICNKAKQKKHASTEEFRAKHAEYERNRRARNQLD